MFMPISRPQPPIHFLSPPEILAALLSRLPELRPVLRFLFLGRDEFRRFRDLRVPPAITSHCNVVSANGFLIPGERFGNTKDVAMIPLVCRVVNEAVESVAGYYPQVRRYLPHIPVAAYGSMGLSVRRLGCIDWDYVRDLDFRIFLPPQIGHTSGFKSALEQRLDLALRHEGLKPVFRGVNEEGLPQVQLREIGSGAIHGFHFYLLGMKPGFIRANIHEGGGYSMYHAYFPEGAMDVYLAEGLSWQELLDRETETYEAMFNRVGYYLFSDDRDKRNVMRKRGWYPHKAFKWYAAMARQRGDYALESELLAQYELFKESRDDPQYFVRDSYYARLNPARAERHELERDVARAFSHEYSLGRTPEGDTLLGERVGAEPGSPLLLEPVNGDWLNDALALLAANADLFDVSSVVSSGFHADTMPRSVRPALASAQTAPETGKMAGTAQAKTGPESNFTGAAGNPTGRVETELTELMETEPVETGENPFAVLTEWAEARRIRFADDLSEPARLTFPNGQPGMALPSGWALLFTDGYARLATASAQQADPPFAPSPESGAAFAFEEVRQALVLLLAAQIAEAWQKPVQADRVGT